MGLLSLMTMPISLWCASVLFILLSLSVCVFNGIPLFNNTIWCILHIILASCDALYDRLTFLHCFTIFFVLYFFLLFLVRTCITLDNNAYAIHLVYTIFAQVNIIFRYYLHYFFFVLFCFEKYCLHGW